MNNEDKKMNVGWDSYSGVVSFKVLDFIRELSDEAKKELLAEGGWWNLVETEMVRQIITEFSRDHFCEEYTRLRGLILNSEAMPGIIREWAVSMIESRERARREENYWRGAYHSLSSVFCTMCREHRVPTIKDIPSLPKGEYGKPLSDEFMAEVEEKIKEWIGFFPEPMDEG